MDPTIRTAVTQSIEHTIRKTLAYDPGTAAALAELGGKILAVQLTAPKLVVYFEFGESGVTVTSSHEQPADCILMGAPPAVLALLWRERHSLADSGVTVTGDAILLQKLQRILGDLDLDWEQALQQGFGTFIGNTNAEMFSHPLAQMLRAQGNWLHRRSETAPLWLHDYLTEELRLLPSPPELNQFNREVDELRADTERLAARIQKLHQTLAATDANPKPAADSRD